MSLGSAGRSACGTGALFAILVIWQVFVPPFVGLANNGDFPKVAGWFALGPARGGWTDNFHFFVSDYVCSDQFSWRNETLSTELALAAISKAFACPAYAKHPIRALQILASDLRTDAYQIRPFNLANRRREDGYPPDTRARTFDTWSNIRSALFRLWPIHAPILLALALLYRRHSCLPSRDSSRLVSAGHSTLTLAAVLAIGEFCIASLADAVETYRHLLLFHFFTDVTICLSIGAAAASAQHLIVRALVSRNLVRL